jgi:Dna[CI] antecedent, DciA
MKRSSSIQSYVPAQVTGFKPARSSSRATPGVTDFLRSNDQMAALLPAIARLAAMQKDCCAILPALFDACSVMQFDAGQLVLATPNAALAAKLKQQLPKLQEGLVQRGWQVNAIRMKVQVGKITEKSKTSKRLLLPNQAYSALATLNESLENAPRNDPLKAAIKRMLSRHGKSSV